VRNALLLTSKEDLKFLILKKEKVLSLFFQPVITGVMKELTIEEPKVKEIGFTPLLSYDYL
jgi:hypothetical protein